MVSFSNHRILLTQYSIDCSSILHVLAPFFLWCFGYIAGDLGGEVGIDWHLPVSIATCKNSNPLQWFLLFLANFLILSSMKKVAARLHC